MRLNASGEAEMTRGSLAALLGAAVLATLLAGCRVEENKNGDSKDVNISTPFGGMHVKTNDTDAHASIGLPVYPGAQPVKEDDDNNRSADVDMSFGGYQLRVKVAKDHTDDSPAKVEAFYRDAMKRFGDVIACRDDHSVGAPSRTREGLTCERGQNGRVNIDDHEGNNKLELKTGSKQHQHIVEIEPDGGGTRIELVGLDLPTANSDDNRQ
jgi:hypothetical protein